MAQTDAQTKEIAGHTYEVKMLPARRGNRMLTRLVRMLGESVAMLLGGDLDKHLDGDLLASVVQRLMLHADEDAVDAIIDQLAEVTLVDGKPLKPIFDIHFAGRQGAVALWVGFALKVQFTDFFDTLVSAIEEAGLGEGLAEKAAAFLSPTASTGASGD